jgi:hypothetical protein
MFRARQLGAILLVGMMAVSVAPAYYHFVHYTGRSAPYLPVPEKFDLRVLPNKTITFFSSDVGPTQYVPNDSFPSVLSQMRQAAKAWNGVATSDVRVTFSGLFSQDTLQAAPGNEIVFDDEIPPGLLAFSTHTAATTPVGRRWQLFSDPRAIVHMQGPDPGSRPQLQPGFSSPWCMKWVTRSACSAPSPQVSCRPR